MIGRVVVIYHTEPMDTPISAELHPPRLYAWSALFKARLVGRSGMVFAFLCHSIGSPCRMLYSAVFGDDLQLATNEVCLLVSTILILEIYRGR